MKYKLSKSKKIIILLLLIIFIIAFTPIVFAKYNTFELLKSNTEIAKPVFEVEGSEDSKISAINNIGTYKFSIRNFNEKGISEIAYLYTIEIIADVDESVKFELYRNDEKIELENLKTKSIFIGANNKIEQNYELKITYDSTLGEKGKDILQDIQIKVYAEQDQIGS